MHLSSSISFIFLYPLAHSLLIKTRSFNTVVRLLLELIHKVFRYTGKIVLFILNQC
jgi:hypothetical protein